MKRDKAKATRKPQQPGPADGLRRDYTRITVGAIEPFAPFAGKPWRCVIRTAPRDVYLGQWIWLAHASVWLWSPWQRAAFDTDLLGDIRDVGLQLNRRGDPGLRLEA